MRKPYGTACRISPYEYRGELGETPPFSGAYLASPAGSVWLILEAFPIKGDTNRLRLECVRFNPHAIPTDATIYTLIWGSRNRTTAPRRIF